MGLRTILSLKLVIPVLALVIGTGWLGGGVTWAPRDAEAGPPRTPTGFQVTGYNATTNAVSFSWSDTEDYPNNETCNYNQSSYTNPGWYVGPVRIASGEASRTGSSSSFYVDGSETFSLRFRWRDEYYTGNEQDDERTRGRVSLLVQFLFKFDHLHVPRQDRHHLRVL